MLVATHETVSWLRNQIGRLRLRQMNGAIMMLSGLAVIVVPMAMSSMHGGHSGHGGDMQMDDSSHSSMPSETGTAAPHDMSQMNHTMTPEMTPKMDHSMHDMSAMPSEHNMSNEHTTTEHAH